MGPPFEIKAEESIISKESPGKISLLAMLGNTMNDVLSAAELLANLNLVNSVSEIA
jgi:hypothetical protein